jgi:hypothetical protein
MECHLTLRPLHKEIQLSAPTDRPTEPFLIGDEMNTCQQKENV